MEELSLELRDRVTNAVEAQTLSTDILYAVVGSVHSFVTSSIYDLLFSSQEIYNATLLQTNDFKDAIVNPEIITFVKAVIIHVSSPTSMPSGVPTYGLHEIKQFQGDDFTLGVSTAGGVAILSKSDLIALRISHCLISPQSYLQFA